MTEEIRKTMRVSFCLGITIVKNFIIGSWTFSEEIQFALQTFTVISCCHWWITSRVIVNLGCISCSYLSVTILHVWVGPSGLSIDKIFEYFTRWKLFHSPQNKTSKEGLFLSEQKKRPCYKYEQLQINTDNHFCVNLIAFLKTKKLTGRLGGLPS